MAIEIRKIETLKEHPQNSAIYGAEHAGIEELARNIEVSGVICKAHHS